MCCSSHTPARYWGSLACVFIVFGVTCVCVHCVGLTCLCVCPLCLGECVCDCVCECVCVCPSRVLRDHVPHLRADAGTHAPPIVSLISSGPCVRACVRVCVFMCD